MHRTKNFLPPAPVTSWDNTGYLCTALSLPGDEDGGSGAEARAPRQDMGGLGRVGREGPGTWGCGKAREQISREKEPEVWIPLRAQRKISEPFEVCPRLRTSSILKSIPDRRARNCWRISKKKESQPNKKYTPGQYIARSLI